MASSALAFVRRHTRLQPIPGLEAILIHQSETVLPLWRAVQLETREPDAALPYWAFAWAGGLALACHLRDQPGVVAGRRVLDLASGSGLCAIAAALAGAAAVTAADIDPFAVAAIGLNARANRRRIAVVQRDLLDETPPAVDVILAGDCWYEATLAERVLPWLQRARDRGIAVLVGDPGRRYLPMPSLVEVARYEVRTTTELEDLERKEARVFALAAHVEAARPRRLEIGSPRGAPRGSATVRPAGGRGRSAP